DLLRAARKEGAIDALAQDSIVRAPGLAREWREVALEVVEEPAALRMLLRCYHLRAATLLAEDAGADGDADAAAHAKAYALRHVTRHEQAIEAMLPQHGARLAGLRPDRMADTPSAGNTDGTD